jgi:hypothetical protein
LDFYAAKGSSWPWKANEWWVSVTSARYEIRVTGVLPPEAFLDFEHLTSYVAPAETLLCGEIADIAALQGLLARLETFGVHVMEIRRLRE